MTQYARCDFGQDMRILGFVTASSPPLVDVVVVPTIVYREMLVPLAAFPDPPTPGAWLKFVYGQAVWQDPRTLAAARTDRIEVMRNAREAQIGGGFTWSGSPFDSSTDARGRLTALYLESLLGGFTPTPWRLADNTWRTLSATDVGNAWVAQQAHVRAAFTQFSTRETSINAASTVAAVQALNW
jgi:hypothetical protein